MKKIEVVKFRTKESNYTNVVYDVVLTVDDYIEQILRPNFQDLKEAQKFGERIATQRNIPLIMPSE